MSLNCVICCRRRQLFTITSSPKPLGQNQSNLKTETVICEIDIERR